MSDDEDEEIYDVDTETAQNFEHPEVCGEADEDSRLHLWLPVKGADGNCRSVEAHCSICFSEYEEGDQIVWSNLRCRHAFHYDCMMPWLIKGKKRCPICRDWFVPGARIDDQRRELEERIARESNQGTRTSFGTVSQLHGVVTGMGDDEDNDDLNSNHESVEDDLDDKKSLEKSDDEERPSAKLEVASEDDSEGEIGEA